MEVWLERLRRAKRALVFLELGVIFLEKTQAVGHLAAEELDMEPQNPLMELKNLHMEEEEEAMEIKVEVVYLVDYQGLEVSFKNLGLKT